MARPLRVEYEGATYHVTARGNERKKIFNAGRDYDKFIEYISAAREKYRFLLHAYVLMGEPIGVNSPHFTNMEPI